MRGIRRFRHPHALMAWAVIGCWVLWVGAPTDAWAISRTYTLDADFDEGILINVNHDSPNNDQLQLNTTTTPFPFIWMACSNRGTIVRVDVNTGAVLGEYHSAPAGRGKNPSRTTVDLYGNVWVGNRDEAGDGMGSVLKIGIVIGGTRGVKNPDGSFTPDPNGEYLQPPFLYNTCVDRDGDGLIRTSVGLGNILPWPDITDGAGGPNGLVEDAEDEAILIFQRTTGVNNRHVSVDANNDVWVGGYPYTPNHFVKLDGDDGAILDTFTPSCGGYGGLVDGNGVIWSAAISQNRLMRRATDGTEMCIGITGSYGLGIDTNGFLWNAMYYSGSVVKVSAAGAVVGGPYPTSGSNPRGVAVTPVDNHVWVANSGSASVVRLNNSGTFLKLIPVGGTPTGVAVDSNGKVWVTNFGSNNAMRIDPNGGGDGLGAVDLTVNLGSGAGPYNYSDMTGIVAVGTTSPQGTWTVVYDSAQPGIEWGTASWTSMEPTGTTVGVEVRAADAVGDLPLQSFQAVTNGMTFAGVFGQYIEIRTTLARPASLDSPILYDLTIESRAIEVAVDIKPMSCPNPINVTKKGVLPVAVVGTMDFDPALIDPASVMLEGVAPLRWAWEDVATPFTGELCDCTWEGADGIMDLSLKFSAQEIVAALGAVTDREVRPLLLTGMLVDGTPIEGSDCVWILVPSNAIAPPAIVTAAAGIDVSWNAAEGDFVLDYAVFRGLTEDFEPASLDDAILRTTELSYLDTDVQVGETWFYRIGVYLSYPVMTPTGEQGFEVFAGFTEAAGLWSGTGVADLTDATVLRLMPLRPNPVRDGAEVIYALPDATPVSMALYDVRGRLSRRLLDATRPAGVHAVRLDARDLAGGIYFLRLEAGREVLVRRVVVAH